MSAPGRFEGVRAVVMGLGLFGGGLGAAKYLIRHGARVTVTDLRSRGELAESVAALDGLDVSWRLGGHARKDFASAELVVVNPAVHPGNEHVEAARAAGARIATEAELVIERVREAGGRILAVTGSKGKSTTTAMLGCIMREHESATLVGGNIGGSLLDEIDSAAPGASAVMELSSYQLHYLGQRGVSPDVAVVTRLSPDHLDWHGGVEAYYRAKEEILRHQTVRGVGVVNADDETSRRLLRVGPGRKLVFSLNSWPRRLGGGVSNPRGPALRDGAYLADGWLVLAGGMSTVSIAPSDALRVPGQHNVANALAAAAAAFAAGVPRELISRGLRAFRGLPDRMEPVASVGGVRYINDSIATTPDSAAASLSALDGTLILIAGGRDKGLDLAPLLAVARERVRAVILTGDARERFERAFAEGAPLVERHRAGGVAEAVRTAAALARPGEAVILSPACASFDEFRNYRDRSAAFRRAVGELTGTAGG